MRILKYNGKLVEEIGHVSGEKVIFLRYIKYEDKPKCECGRVIEKDIDIVENCLNWKNEISGVETLSI
jgi:hypothetical protein